MARREDARDLARKLEWWFLVFVVAFGAWGVSQ